MIRKYSAVYKKNNATETNRGNQKHMALKSAKMIIEFLFVIYKGKKITIYAYYFLRTNHKKKNIFTCLTKKSGRPGTSIILVKNMHHDDFFFDFTFCLVVFFIVSIALGL